MEAGLEILLHSSGVEPRNRGTTHCKPVLKLCAQALDRRSSGLVILNMYLLSVRHICRRNREDKNEDCRWLIKRFVGILVNTHQAYFYNLRNGRGPGFSENLNFPGLLFGGAEERKR